MFHIKFYCALLLCTLAWCFTGEEITLYRDEVRKMFYHAYDSYMKYAYPYDELRPLTCDGHDTWGSYSLTLVDALDTLAVLGNKTEFQRVYNIVLNKVDFDSDINVSVFETNIRIIGGLLSGHLMSRRMEVSLHPEWPCAGPLLNLSVNVANRLLPAFDTTTGMPYGTVNLRDGVPEGETSVTCAACVGTFLVEFGTLSRLTGNPLYEEVALRALYSLWNHRSPLDLIGNHIDVNTGKWTALDSGIGAGIDSFYEYLVKGAALLQRPELMAIFEDARRAVDKYTKHDDWYLWVTMSKGQVTMPVFQSLEAYWPGVLVLAGDVEAAQRTLFNYHQVWKQTGFTPEFYNIVKGEASANREGYPLRPEFVESLMYLYQATGDSIFLEMGADVVTSLRQTRTECGYATVKNINDHSLDNRMESFFLAETTKYLYLLFSPEHWLHSSGQNGRIHKMNDRECLIEAGYYIFNSEAHPVDPSAFGCCTHELRNGLLPYDFLLQVLLEPDKPVRRPPNRPPTILNNCTGEIQAEASARIDMEVGIDLFLESSGTSEILVAEPEEASGSHVNVTVGAADVGAMADNASLGYNYTKLSGAAEAFGMSDVDSVTMDGPVQVSEGVEEAFERDSDALNEESLLTFSPLKREGLPAGDSNMSDMEDAGVTTSVSSSKYSFTFSFYGRGKVVPMEEVSPRAILSHSKKRKLFHVDELQDKLTIDMVSYRNFSLTVPYKYLSCPAPPFTRILHYRGQMIGP